MTKKEFDDYISSLADDERNYAIFLNHSAFALIASNFVLIQSSMKHMPVLIAGSLLSSVLFLFVRAMRHRLNLAHLREVLENHAEKTSFTARDRSLSVNTPYSRFSNALNHFELPLIITSASLFLASSILAITTHL